MVKRTRHGAHLRRRDPVGRHGHNELKDPSGFPANVRPWGTLTALDLAAGETRWQVPLGTYPELEEQGLPPTGTFNIGGPLVTAGGLVFIGAAMDERFPRLRRRDRRASLGGPDGGRRLRESRNLRGQGRQYVVIAAGGGEKPGTPPGDAYYCFALREGSIR
jgi:quinoprotein glucose dehydrogenase